MERETHVRGPGDEEDYKTPARPVKRVKMTDEEKGKYVRWDKGLVVIRRREDPEEEEGDEEGKKEIDEEEGDRPSSRMSSSDVGRGRSCLRDDVQVSRLCY